MASVHTIPFLIIILILQTWSATSSIFAPFVGGDVCKSAECGKGTCKPSNDSNFGFACQCDDGWKQARLEHDDGLKFLPCVIPNCSLNYSCGQAPPPAPAREKRANESIFDPCYWAVCGGGTCNKTSIFGHKCECQEGYYNILNVTAFPCFRECELGMDCKHLGIGVMNNTPASSPPSLLPENGQNQATSIAVGDLTWSMFTMVLSVALLLSK
ncbi:uncharacterized protein [Coffea arabica]|uniref:Uncharacterized protein n=1 Tax=Coffea arabica TaxID=13443 RepID=A0A6P6WNX5_COFAR|nr:uncharacterized protein LOC113734166 [Coffea arabica]